MDPTVDTAIVCPTCSGPSAQRIDSQVGAETIASCVCANGHLFVTQWQADQ